MITSTIIAHGRQLFGAGRLLFAVGKRQLFAARLWPASARLRPVAAGLLGMGFLACVVGTACSHKQTQTLSQKEELGKLLFFDESLSEPAGQSCATCHTPEKGLADKDGRAVSEGAVPGLFGNRNAQTAAYAAYIPPLHYDEEEATYIGGFFWDGRTNSLEEQAKQPFLNPLEMGNRNAEMVVGKVMKAPYFHLFREVYGELANTDLVFNAVADAIGAYERSAEVNPFSSKYDAWEAGWYQLTAEEALGLELFKDKGLCAECHILDPDPLAGRVLFTDHTYDNLGIPPNPSNPFYTIPATYNPAGRDTLDYGLGMIVGLESEYGKFRVPTLRNIELTAPYGHNGYFLTLEDIVHFYNVRDAGTEYPPAEYPATVNTEELGNLLLTPEEEAALVAFMKTLTDGGFGSYGW